MSISSEEWEHLEEIECEFLDTIDLLPFIQNEKQVWEVMQEIEDKYEDEYLKQYPDDECMFNVMDEYDFSEYVKRTYGIGSYEYTEFRFRGKK